MDAARALADLKQISAQIQHVVIFDGDGDVVGSTIEGEGRAEVAAEAAARLLRAAGDAAETDEQVVQLEASLEGGSVVVVREGDSAIAATTAPEPTIGLVFYDLRTCLRQLTQEEKDDSPAQQRAASAGDESA